jgi:hypothetical protein
MQHVLTSGELVHGKRLVNAHGEIEEREDDLGFAAGLRVAIPAGIALWGAVIYAVIRFIA